LRALPESQLIAGSVNLPMMTPAEWNGKFVADFASKCTQLGEPQMVCIGWGSAADETRLPSDELEMLFVSDPARFGECEYALIDLCWRMSFA